MRVIFNKKRLAQLSRAYVVLESFGTRLVVIPVENGGLFISW
jgi:hypothetical protein